MSETTLEYKVGGGREFDEMIDRRRHIRGLKLIIQHLEYERGRAASAAAALSLSALQNIAYDILRDLEGMSA